MDLREFEEKRDGLCEQMRTVAEIADVLSLDAQKELLLQMETHLREENFHLAVVGEFSRGKSTFVNALLGRRILPSGKNPTTAIISRILYGETPSYAVCYRDSDAEHPMTEQAFLEMKAPAERGEEESTAYYKEREQLAQIDYALVRYPLSFCKNHVEIVDTPGLNDVNVNRVEITCRYLNQADAVLFLLAADQAMTKTETEFLQDRIASGQFEDVFFVINRKDELHGAEEERSVVAFVRDNIGKIVPPYFRYQDRIFLVSGKQALSYRRKEAGETLSPMALRKLPTTFAETGFPALEASMGDYLGREKGETRIMLYTKRFQTPLREVRNVVVKNRSMMQNSLDDLRASMEKLRPEFQRKKDDVARILQEMKRRLDMAEHEMTNQFSIGAANLLRAVNQATDSYVGELQVKRMQADVAQATAEPQKELVERVGKTQQDILTREQSTTMKALKKILREMDDTFSETLHLSVIETQLAVIDDGALAFVDARKERKTDWSLLRKIGKEATLFFEQDKLVEGIMSAACMTIVTAFLASSWIVDRVNDYIDEGAIRDRARANIYNQYKNNIEKTRSDVMKKYRSQAKDVVRMVEKRATGYLEDMERNLQQMIVEQERDAAGKQKRLAAIDRQLHVLDAICGMR